MTYQQAVDRLGLASVCLGGCGIRERSHRHGFIYLDVVHFGERRVTKRGLRRFLLLVARRDRQLDPGFLNDEHLYWYLYLYMDEQVANDWAAELGVRFPVSFSLPERRVVALIPGLSRRQPAIYAWAHRGIT